MDDFNGDIIGYCQNPEQFGDGTAAYILPTNRPTWWLDDELPWMKRSKLEEVIQAAIDGWTPHCDVKGTRAVSREKANWLYQVKAIDGQGNTLAQAQLPSPNLRQQWCQIDAAESALADALVLILMHEDGHLLGCQHFPPSPPPELMEPVLNRRITGPQPTEAALMAKWYGLPKVEVPVPRPAPEGTLVCTMKATPTATEFACEIAAEMGGKKVELKGKKPWA